MITFWQEIVTFVILGTAVFFLARRYFFPAGKVKGAGAEECAPCSTGSCNGCAVMDLKKEIEMKREIREEKTDKAKPHPEAMNAGLTDTPAPVNESDPDEKRDPSAAGSAPAEKEYWKMCLDACIQVRRMGLK